MRAVPSTGGAGTLTYILSDHLGSTTTTITNGLIAKESYYPFGATRSTTGAVPTDKLFTGQQQEPGDSLGLYNYGARFYSTALGRFVSVDPIVGNARNPQSWNAYSYAGNNPLRYTDPTGKRRTDQIEADEQTWHEQRDHDDLVGALLYLDAQNQAAAAWAAQEPHACQLCADWRAAADAYAWTSAVAMGVGPGPSSPEGSGDGWDWGGVGGWLGDHVARPVAATGVVALDIYGTSQAIEGAIVTDGATIQYGSVGFEVGSLGSCLACAFVGAALLGSLGYVAGSVESAPTRAQGAAAQTAATTIRGRLDPSFDRDLVPPSVDVEANYGAYDSIKQTGDDAGWAGHVWLKAFGVE